MLPVIISVFSHMYVYYAVVEPVITDFQQVDNRPQIRMTIGSFSDEQGDLRSVIELRIP